MTNKEKHKQYLSDLGFLLKEYSSEAKKNYIKEKSGQNGAFHEGYLMGFHRVITLMQQQASVFSIPLSEIQLDDIDPDKDFF